MALDGKVESLASILIEVDGSKAGFYVRSRKMIQEDGQLKIIKKLKVVREPAHGIGEIEPFAAKHPPYIEALRQVMRLWDKKFEEVSVTSLCRTCTTEVDRLPRPVV
jgi:hypothetical protein